MFTAILHARSAVLMRFALRFVPRFALLRFALRRFVLLLASGTARARIDGISGPTFALRARADTLSMADGGSFLFWGYADGTGRAQYPGPTLIVNQGDTVSITLTNELPQNVSIVFPGMSGVTETGGVPGLLAAEAPGDGTTAVTYSFVAREPGTFLYYSGSHPELQIEMGLVGALIVRPAGFDPAAPRAYSSPGSSYTHEYLFLLSEIDPVIHDPVAQGKIDQVDNTKARAEYWLINGRAAPDTLQDAYVPWLPTQPYNCLPRMHPGDTVLMRVIGAGRDIHPFHHHGNHARLIARDGRLLESSRGVSGPDLALDVFTVPSVPGGTFDLLFHWTGQALGWDVYGHRPTDPLETFEYQPDHGRPIPVTLPSVNTVAIGPMYSGSPYLGVLGALPPGQGGLNTDGAYYYMWHSHTEMEIVNNDIFPGGMMTMLIVEPPDVPIQ
jgi:FtsP/CotA-like multicopper oxidase with cupredoxin domain